METYDIGLFVLNVQGYAFVKVFINVIFVAASQEKQKKEVENELLRKVSQGDAVKENDTDSRDFVDYVEDFVDFVEGGKKNAIRTSNNKTNISKTSSKLIMKGTQKLS